MPSTIFSTTFSGLPALERLLARDLPLVGQVLLGDLFASNVAGCGGRDVHGQAPDQPLEVLAAGGEVSLAVDLDQDADLPTGVDVRADLPLARSPIGLLGGRGGALLAQQLLRLGDVSVRLFEGGLALHHPDSGLLAELLHLGCADLHADS